MSFNDVFAVDDAAAPEDWEFFVPAKLGAIELRARTFGCLRHEVHFPEIPERKEGPWNIVYSHSLLVNNEQWFAERTRQAMFVLHECVEINPRKLGGIPVFRGTRFSVAQLISELADSNAVIEISSDFELDQENIKRFLHALAVFLNKPSV